MKRSAEIWQVLPACVTRVLSTPMDCALLVRVQALALPSAWRQGTATTAVVAGGTGACSR